MSPSTFDRSSFSTSDTITHLWRHLSLPEHPLASISLPGSGPGLPSSFKVGHLAQATISLAALTAALIHSSRTASSNILTVTVPLTHACLEFLSERLYTLNKQPPTRSSFPIGGLHRTSDGYVRIHEGFPHHRANALSLIGCAPDATREDVKAKLATLSALDLEERAPDAGAIVAALRSPSQWDATPQGKAVADYPVAVRRIAGDGDGGGSVTGGGGGGGGGYWPLPSAVKGHHKPLSGLRVIEFSRVLAAPVCGRTLAAYGADVVWVTSPGLPDLPNLDKDTARGKRTVQLDLETEEGKVRLRELVGGADVFVQGYRPGGLEGKGFGVGEVVGLVGKEAEKGGREGREGVVYASLSAYGSEGPWKRRRGFDSIVQTQSGINVAEAQAHAEWKGSGERQASRVLPCQALDHASGYLLAFGIMAALHKKAEGGGNYVVDVSLAGTMKYLRSLGRLKGSEAFRCAEFESQYDVPEELLETRDSEFGTLTALKHSANIEGVDVGWDIMPKALGSDEPKWL